MRNGAGTTQGRRPPAACAPPTPTGHPPPSGTSWPATSAADSSSSPPPLADCRDAPDGPATRAFFKGLKNPYLIGDSPSLTQTSGWVDAWTSAPSAYAVAAQNTNDVVAAVNFARAHHLRLVV